MCYAPLFFCAGPLPLSGIRGGDPGLPGGCQHLLRAQVPQPILCVLAVPLWLLNPKPTSAAFNCTSASQGGTELLGAVVLWHLVFNEFIDIFSLLMQFVTRVLLVGFDAYLAYFFNLHRS